MEKRAGSQEAPSETQLSTCSGYMFKGPCTALDPLNLPRHLRLYCAPDWLPWSNGHTPTHLDIHVILGMSGRAPVCGRLARLTRWRPKAMSLDVAVLGEAVTPAFCVLYQPRKPRKRQFCGNTTQIKVMSPLYLK